MAAPLAAEVRNGLRHFRSSDGRAADTSHLVRPLVVGGNPLSVQGAALMATSTALVLTCLGIACICMLAPKGWNWSAATILAAVALSLAGVAAFGHLFRVTALYAISGQVMSLPGAILSVLVALSLITARPPQGVISSLIEHVGSKWLNLPIRYKCFVMASLPVACLVFEIGWQIRLLSGLTDAQQWMTHTQEVELTAADLQRLLLQIESNDRGYGLSGSEEFVLPLQQQEGQVPAIAEKLSRLVQDNPLQRSRARNLQELAAVKVSFARGVTDFFSSQPGVIRTPAMRLRLLESKARMDELMELSHVFVAEEERLREERLQKVRQQQELSRRVLVFTIFTGIGTGILTILIFSWSVSDRLSVLQDDSAHLARGEIIPAPLPGDDEVSNLAWALHAASHKIHDQMQGLEALNRDLESFSYSVSHDLRAPLRHIHGFSKILQEDFGSVLPEEANRYLSRIATGVERMGQLIDDLLNFSRVGRREIERKPVPLRPIVDDVIHQLSELSTERQVEWRLNPLPTVQADPALIKQIFANLLGNAAKFSRTREHPRVEVGAQSSEQGPAIYVRDNGVGFDMKFADKLFGVFQRLHRSEDFEGTGVGLATVARIVHKHGGAVWADSSPDQGATFFFTLGHSAMASSVQEHPDFHHEVLYAAAR